jgi:hypothetical protein
MNASSKINRPGASFVRPAVIAVALAFPALVFGADMNDSVTTRTNPNLEQQHGRDSVYALTSAPVYSAAQVEPQRYGRAGGYVGTDRVEVIKQQPPEISARTPEAAAATGDSGPRTGNRFDNRDSAHGQSETGMQTQ